MTRKHFEKKLMGCGIQRNEARHIAETLPVGRSYEDHLREVGIQARMLHCRLVLLAKPLLMGMQDAIRDRLANVSIRCPDPVVGIGLGNNLPSKSDEGDNV